jgi:hypothetical protein
VIGVDTNLLVYAHREDSPWHDGACACVAGLAEGRTPWAIPKWGTPRTYRTFLLTLPRGGDSLPTCRVAPDSMRPVRCIT